MLFTIEILGLIQHVNLEVTIIGPVKDQKYWVKCREAIAKLPNHIKVRYMGAIPNDQIQEATSDCHVLLLPTWHENYGHSIIESLGKGIPAIISPHTPWKNLLASNAGMEISLDETEKWAEGIKWFCDMNQQEYTTMSKGAHEYACSFLGNPNLKEASRKLFS